MAWICEKARWHKCTEFSRISVRSAPLLIRNYLAFDDLNVYIPDKSFYRNHRNKRLLLGKSKKSMHRVLTKSWLEQSACKRIKLL